MEQYLRLSKLILTSENSVYKPNRTGVDTISRFGLQEEYDLREGFPLLTTKKIPYKMVFHELNWFLKGETNIKSLVDNGVHIWDGNAFQYHLKNEGLEGKFPIYSDEWHQRRTDFVKRIEEDPKFAAQHGNLGEVYGAQWRHWKTRDGREIDQINDLVSKLKGGPKSWQSRRMIVTAWNPEDVPSMALPPCHSLFHVNITPEGNLDVHLYQRSADMFLGVPFNVASYAALTHILANQHRGLSPGRFIHTLGDAHFYCGADKRGEFYGNNLIELKQRLKESKTPENYKKTASWIETNASAETPGKEGLDHVTGIIEQLSREPEKLPTIEISKKPFDELTIDDYMIKNYSPRPSIKRAMAV